MIGLTRAGAGTAAAAARAGPLTEAEWGPAARACGRLSGKGLGWETDRNRASDPAGAMQGAGIRAAGPARRARRNDRCIGVPAGVAFGGGGRSVEVRAATSSGRRRRQRLLSQPLVVRLRAQTALQCKGVGTPAGSRSR